MAYRPKRYVIIGNGVAGTTAAEQLKKDDPNAIVHLITDEPYPLYNRVALPPLLRGDVREEKVMMRSVSDHEAKGIDLHLETRVVGIDVEEKVVVTENDRTLPYDRLLIATGGSPNPLPAPGAKGTRRIYSFQTLDDTKEIVAALKESKTAVAIGGSFISYELAEGFRARGLETTWIMRGPHFLRRILDEDGGRLVDRIAKGHGVRMIYGHEIARVQANGGVVASVTTKGGETVPADLIGVGLGLTLNTSLLDDTGIQVNRGVPTDQFLRTSHPDVFAAGDVAEFFDSVVEGYHTMGTWNNAASHGKVSAKNMQGASEPYVTVPTYTSGLFDSKLAVMGATPEISSELESCSTLDMESRSYRRFFFYGDRLVGAVLIGDMRPRRTILKMIRGGERVSDRRALLDGV